MKNRRAMMNRNIKDQITRKREKNIKKKQKTQKGKKMKPL